MIKLLPPPLQINQFCRHVSCRFDHSLAQAETARLFDLVLPPHLNGAVQKRQAEFLAGRYCARNALAQFSEEVAAENIGSGQNREPVWPTAYTGSITHTQGYAAAVVASRQQVRTVGIDCEPWINPATAELVARQILTGREKHADHDHLFQSSQQYLTLVFSAKESLFKCLFPLVNRFFDFQAAEIIPVSDGSGSSGEFRFELVEDLGEEFRAGYCGSGVYVTDGEFVHTGVAIMVADGVGY